MYFHGRPAGSFSICDAHTLTSKEIVEAAISITLTGIPYNSSKSPPNTFAISEVPSLAIGGQTTVILPDILDTMIVCAITAS
ncbi:hypothetical protein BC829DRAFT_389698 [Chytridium lagenaria]|nr:hypothetical protein BC829DRAFT_389698 [Chytridium lagenaria]